MKSIFILFFIVVLTSPLLAQQGNYQNYPLGARAAGLGGAFTAVADDSTSAWYNPGGLAFLNSTSVSLSATAYNYFETDRKDQFGKGKNLVSSSFSAIPAVVTTTYPIFNGTLTFVILEPKFLNFDETETDISDGAGGFYSFFKRYSHHQLWAGFAYGIKLTPKIGFGFSILGVEVGLAQEEIKEAPDSASPPNTIDFEHSGMSMTTYFLTISTGILYLYDRNWKFGAHIRTGGISLGSASGGEGYKVINDTANPLNNYYAVEKGLETEYNIPWRFFVGASYSEPDEYLFSLEIAFQSGCSYFKYLKSANLPYGIEYNPVFNINFGANYHFAEGFEVRGGIYTDIAPEPSPTASRNWSKVNIFGISAGIAWKEGDTTTSITLIFAGGSGEAISEAGLPVDFVVNTFFVVIGISHKL